jgi:hypothetical protein
MRSILRALLPLLLGVAAPAAGQTTTTPWLTLPRGTDYTLPAAGASTTLRIPVRRSATVDWQSVRVVVTDVNNGGRSEGWMMDAAGKLDKSPANAAGGPALLLPVAPDAFREAGTYLVEVEATAGRQTQRLQLRFTRPAAQVTAAPIQLRRSVGFGRSVGAWADSVLVRETSGTASIVQLTPRPPLFAVPGGATLRFSSAPVRIAAGGTTRIPFQVDGQLPLGITTGTMQLASPQMSAPVDVPVTIRTQRPEWTLFAAIALGLVVGWLARNYLVRSIERGRLRLQADDVLVQMDEHRTAHADADFRTQVDALADPLHHARDRGSPAALTAAITTADTGLRTALEGLAARLAAARDRAAALARLVRTEWDLPSPAAAAFHRARAAVAAAEADLARHDAAGAGRRLTGAEDTLKTAIGDVVAKWPLQAANTLDELAELPPGLKEGAATWIEALRTDVGQVVQPEADDLETLRPMLGVIHRARTREAQLAAALAEWVGAMGARVIDALQDGTPDAAALAAFRAELQAFDRAATGPDRNPDPDQALQALALHGLPAVEEAFRTVIAVHAPAAAASEVKTLLDERRYVEAATRAAVSVEGSVLNEDGEAPGDAAPETDGAEVPDVAAPATPAAGGVPLPTIGVPQRVRLHRVRVWWQLLLDQALLSLIVAAAIALTGYYLYAADFVGTGRELLTIFLWAFGLDVGIETLVAQSARLAPATAGAAVGAAAGASGAVADGAAAAGAGGGAAASRAGAAVDENRASG